MHTTIRETLAIYKPASPDVTVTSPEHLAELVVPMFDGLDREACLLVTLDTKHHHIASHIVSVGSIQQTFMNTREIMRECLLDNASAFAVAHNHPSGDPEPSADDESVTRRIVRAADLMSITLLDHLIVGNDRWVSLARRGLI